MYLISLHGHGDVGLARRQRLADRVHGRDEEAVVAQRVQRRLAHPGHDPHRDGDIGAVGDLDAQRADLRADRAHAERHDIHGASAHRAVEQAVQVGAHLGGVEPVVGGAGVGGVLRADEGAALDAGDVLGIGGGVEGVGALVRIQPFERPGGDQFVGERLPLLLRAVAPVHAVGLGQGGDRRPPTRSGAGGAWAPDKGPESNWSSTAFARPACVASPCRYVLEA